ncbi:MAG: hypothetical protein R2850_11125 [Bacteroidia bacterium]
MKYCSTGILNKALVLLFGLFAITSQAQTLSQSPYGRFALGDLQYTPSPYQQSMGGLSKAVADSNILSFNQPAALAFLERGVTIFEAGLSGAQTSYVYPNRSTTGRTAGFGYFGLAFPVFKKFWNASISLVPVSNVGYVLRDTVTNALAGDAYLSYAGAGGYSAFSMTHGFRLGKNFSLGIQGSYTFGRTDYKSLLYFPDALNDGNRNSLITRTNQLNGFDLNTGLMYRKYFRKRKPSEDGKTRKDSLHLTLGGTFHPLMNLNGTYSYLAQSFFGAGPGVLSVAGTNDTVSYIGNQKGSISMPMQYGGGITLSNSAEKWLIGAEYVYTDWNNFRLFGAVDSVKSSFRLAAGLQIIPAGNNFTGKVSYFKRIRYRAGFSFSDGYLLVDGQQLPEMAVSIGLGLPVVLRTYNTRPATSILNLSVTAGRRGTRGSNPLVEEYLRLTLGFSLNDRWFRKIKYD